MAWNSTNYPSDIFDAASRQWLQIKYESEEQWKNEVIARITWLWSGLCDVNTRAATNTASIGNNTAGIKTNATNITALQTAVADLQTRVQNQETSNEAFKAAVNQLLGNFSAQLSAQSGRLDGLNTTVINHEGRLTKLESTVNVDLINNAIELASQIDPKIKAAIQSYDATTVQPAIAQAKQDCLDTIGKETTRATGAETNLGSRIDAQSATFNSAMCNQTNRVDALDANLQAEAQRAMDSEKSIRTDLASEVSRAKAAEDCLQACINNETKKRVAMDDNIQQQLADEASVRKGRDDELDEIFSTYYKQLCDGLQEETDRAEKAEGDLNGYIGQVSNTLTAQIDKQFGIVNATANQALQMGNNALDQANRNAAAIANWQTVQQGVMKEMNDLGTRVVKLESAQKTVSNVPNGSTFTTPAFTYANGQLKAMDGYSVYVNNGTAMAAPMNLTPKSSYFLFAVDANNNPVAEYNILTDGGAATTKMVAMFYGKTIAAN